MQEKKSKFSNDYEPAKEGQDEQKKVDNEKKQHHDLHVQITKTSDIHKWQELKSPSVQPERRSNCLSCVFNNKLFVYGGIDLNEGQRDSLYYIDLQEKLDWVKAEIAGNRIGRFSNSAGALVGNKWYIFGGVIENSPSNALFSLDLETLTGEFLIPNKETTFSMPKTESHSMVAIGEDKLVVFGGYSGVHKNSKLFTYSIQENLWTELQPSSPLPPPRDCHAAVYHSGILYIFGGSNEDNEKLADQ